MTFYELFALLNSKKAGFYACFNDYLYNYA